MKVFRQHVGRLDCFVTLLILLTTSPSCLCYVSIPTRTNVGKVRNIRPLVPSTAPRPPSMNENGKMFPLKSASGKLLGRHHRQSKPLLAYKPYYERLEDSSGKDYAWIKPLTKPVSILMKYVRVIPVKESLFDLLFVLTVTIFI